MRRLRRQLRKRSMGQGDKDNDRRTHGRDFFAGRRQRERLSRFSVHFFRLGVSKQNGVCFLRRRDALKRHPCRIGLNRASVHGFPYVSAFC